MPYYRTEITAGKTIEVIKSYSKRIGDHRNGESKPKERRGEVKEID